MTGWQPITSAPKSALFPPKLDLWINDPRKGGYRVPDAFWDGRRWTITIQFGFRISAFAAGHTATHWMRRPGPPDD